MSNTNVLKPNEAFMNGHYNPPKKTEHDVLLVVAEMRRFQKSYFKNRNTDYLVRCKQLENEVDRLLAEYLKINNDPAKPVTQCRIF